MKSVYKKLVNFPDAVDISLKTIEPIREAEKIDIFDSVGRILSENIYAPRNNPPFNRSTMDGYALRSSSVANASQDNPVRLKIAGESFIGEKRKVLDDKDNCFKISTGAILPAGSDSVVKVESTFEKDGFVDIMEPVSPSDNIAESGSDIATSELLLAAGKELETHDVAVLASLGIPEVTVRRKLKVTVISTGNELINYRDNYSEGKVNDANGVVISAELNSLKCFKANYSGIVKDDYNLIKGKIESSLEESDVVILSGGSSAGESDLVYRIIEEFDPGMIFHGVLVKPGLPTVLGRKGGKTLIGLPGFPVSALMIFRSIFLIPLLRAAGSPRVPAKKSGKLGVNLRLEMGKQNLIPVSLVERDKSRIYPVTGLSGSITRFTSTSGFLSLKGNTKFLEKGSEVDIISWSNEIPRGEKVFSGMFLKDISSDYVKEGVEWEFNRMMPRDALKSLENDDTDVAVFIADSLMDLPGYISQETESLGLQVYRGQEINLVFASKFDLPDLDFSKNIVNGETTVSGPSLRLLKNIVNQNTILRKMVGTLESVLTSYNVSDFVNSARDTADGKSKYCITTIKEAEKHGLKSTGICSIIPVFATTPRNKTKSAQFLNITKLVPIQ